MKILIEEEYYNKVIDLIEKHQLIKKDRKAAKIYKRCYIYHYLYSKGMTLEDIGKTFNRNHATVMNGLKVYRHMIETNNKAFEFSVIKIAKELKGDNIFDDPLVHDIHKALSLDDCQKAKKILRMLFKNLTGMSHKKIYNILQE